MKSKYLPKNFEEKWIRKWEKDKIYRTSEKKDKSYILDMFPYPSGSGLHVGHVRIYTASDVLARFFRLKGKNVLHPMGWDAFGLPAENVAIKAKKNPIDMVPKNIEVFKKQMKNLGFSYDWDREFSTTDPNYYKWTQWLFIQFFKSGLLYKKTTPVYYCEYCKTGLAEEEVLANGKHERCGNEITRKTLPQWIFRINLYANDLLKDLDGLDWPDGIKKMQKNWIGRSEGMDIDFKVISNKLEVKRIKVFTTRQDTIFGATGIIIAPEHRLVEEILNNKEIDIEVDRNKIKKYAEDAKKKSDLARTDLEKNKTGIFSGLYAENPVNQKKVPIWIADYVVGWHGYGAVMFVPDGDKRDFEFAKKYGLLIEKVVERENYDEPYVDEGYLLKNKDIENFINDDSFFEKKIETKFFRDLISKKIEERGFGKKNVQYKLRNWIFSRQRYWGEPIPMIFCQKCADAKILWWDINSENKQKLVHNLDQDMQEMLYGWFPISEKELPLKLPHLESYEPGAFGESPLSNAKDWMQTICPNCKNPAKRESDTMPNWAGSCWYFLAFPSWNQEKSKLQMTNDKPQINYKTQAKNSKRLEFKNLNLFGAWNLKFRALILDWLPVDWYLGGAEHAVLHLLYSRFWIKALYRLKLVDIKEPFLRLRNVGLVIAEDKRKMSKSFGNIINPDDIISEFGADALRITEMFMAPFSQEIA
ncbi:MAG: leucine--tRNA ligase, partial [bacterium]